MATKGDVLKLKIQVDNKKALRETKQFENRVQNSNRAIRTSNKRTAASFNKVAAAIGGLVGIALATQAIRMFVRGLVATTKAAAVQEAAEIKLAQAIAITGRSSRQVLPALKEQASAYQDLTGFGDEVILGNQALLVSMGKLEGEGLARATQAALDLAAANGMQLRAAFDLVAKAAVGYTGTLSRYGIIIDQSLPQSEKFSAALDKIEDSFGGQAQARMKSYTGRLIELDGRFGDLQESVGGPVSEVFKTFLGEVLSPMLKDMTGMVTESEDFRDAILDLGIAFAQLGSKIENLPLGALVKMVVLIGRGEMEKHFTAANALLGAMGVEADTTTGFFKNMEEELKRLKVEGPDQNSFGREFEGANDEAKELVETVTSLGTRMLTIDEVVSRMANDGLPVLNAQLMASGDTIEEVGTMISRDIRKEGLSGFQELGDTAVDAAFGAKTAWDQFIKKLLKDIAKAIIKALILKAITKGIGGGGGGAVMAGGGIAGAANAYGSIVGAADGVMVRGGVAGRDSVPIIAQRGEAVLPVALTSMLMGVAKISQQQTTRSMSASSDVDLATSTTPQLHLHVPPGGFADKQSLRRMMEDSPDEFQAGYRRMIRVGG